MMRTKPLILLLTLLLSSASCYYSDPSIYDVEITTDYNPEVQVLSNLTGNDSVDINDSLLLEFEIIIDTGRFFFADLYLGNFPLTRIDSVIDSVWFAPYYVTDPGNYTLSLVSYIKSYTGSLADIFDAELMAFDTSWNISITLDTVQ